MEDVYIYILKKYQNIFEIFVSLYLSLSLSLIFFSLSFSSLPLLFLFKITKQPRPLGVI